MEIGGREREREFIMNDTDSAEVVAPVCGCIGEVCHCREKDVQTVERIQRIQIIPQQSSNQPGFLLTEEDRGGK